MTSSVSRANRKPGSSSSPKGRKFPAVEQKLRGSGAACSAVMCPPLCSKGALQAAAKAGERLHGLHCELDLLREKMENERIVSRAKVILVERRDMTESEAHRYIEKAAMDGRVSRRKDRPANFQARRRALRRRIILRGRSGRIRTDRSQNKRPISTRFARRYFFYIMKRPPRKISAGGPHAVPERQYGGWPIGSAQTVMSFHSCFLAVACIAFSRFTCFTTLHITKKPHTAKTTMRPIPPKKSATSPPSIVGDIIGPFAVPVHRIGTREGIENVLDVAAQNGVIGCRRRLPRMRRGSARFRSPPAYAICLVSMKGSVLKSVMTFP